MRTVALAFVLTLPARSEEAKLWTAEIAFTAPTKVGGCVVADVDPRFPGREIVAASTSGEIFAVRRERGAWMSELMAKAAGEMIQCAAGELDPDAPGDEVVAVGMASGGEDEGGPGAAHVLRWTGKAWKCAEILRDTDLIHGVCIADLDPTRPGNEVLLVGFSAKATMVFREGGGWAAEPAADLGAAGKSAVGFDGGAAVACTSGRLIHVRKGPDGWKSTVLDEASAGLARLGTDGTRLVAARDDGALGLFAGGKRADIYREDLKLRGAVLADLDPTSPGLEAATGGYKARLVVLREGRDGWQAETVFEDTAPIHNVASGELLEEGAGVELVACGHSKRVIVVRRNR